MLEKLKNNLYNRWSFNLLIWHGFRVLLRFLYFSQISPFKDSWNQDQTYIFLALMWIFSVAFITLIVTSIPLFLIKLENRYGFRINKKYLKNNYLFIPYLLLSIPCLLMEIIWFVLLTLFTTIGLYNVICDPGILEDFFIFPWGQAFIYYF